MRIIDNKIFIPDEGTDNHKISEAKDIRFVLGKNSIEINADSRGEVKEEGIWTEVHFYFHAIVKKSCMASVTTHFASDQGRYAVELDYGQNTFRCFFLEAEDAEELHKELSEWMLK